MTHNQTSSVCTSTRLSRLLTATILSVGALSVTCAIAQAAPQSNGHRNSSTNVAQSARHNDSSSNENNRSTARNDNRNNNNSNKSDYRSDNHHDYNSRSKDARPSFSTKHNNFPTRNNTPSRNYNYAPPRSNNYPHFNNNRPVFRNNLSTFTGRVTDVSRDGNFELRVGNQTYDVRPNSRLPRGFDKGDIVRVDGIRSGHDDIVNASVSIVRNR